MSKCSKGYNLKLQKLKTNSSLTAYDLDALTFLFRELFSIEPKQRPTLQQLRTNKWMRGGETGERQTTDESEGSEEDCSFEVDKCKFLRGIQEEVREANYLTELEETAFRYYINKMLVILLGSRSDKELLRIAQ